MFEKPLSTEHGRALGRRFSHHLGSQWKRPHRKVVGTVKAIDYWLKPFANSCTISNRFNMILTTPMLSVVMNDLQLFQFRIRYKLPYKDVPAKRWCLLAIAVGTLLGNGVQPGVHCEEKGHGQEHPWTTFGPCQRHQGPRYCSCRWWLPMASDWLTDVNRNYD